MANNAKDFRIRRTGRTEREAQENARKALISAANLQGYTRKVGNFSYAPARISHNRYSVTARGKFSKA
jgi:hypothetical protein